MKLYDQVELKWAGDGPGGSAYLSQFSGDGERHLVGSGFTGTIIYLFNRNTHFWDCCIALPPNAKEYGAWLFSVELGYRPMIIKCLTQQHVFWNCCFDNLIKL